MTGVIFAVLERTGKELIEIVFTLHPSLANPDKQGVWRGEEVPQLFTTLHLSSPSRRDRLICSSNSSRNRRLGNWNCRMPPLLVVAETWVKSGEELSLLFTSSNALFIEVCEGWVKSEEYFMTPLFIQISKSRIHGVGLCFLSLIAGFTMLCGQPTVRYGDSWLF